MTPSPHSQPDRPILLKRGVYKAPYQIDGFPVLIAVDSAGNRRKTVVLKLGVDATQATADLRAWLDDTDPTLTLT